MAKRSRGSSTVTELQVASLVNAPGKGAWISIPRELSKVNHRLYRDHMNYYAEVTLNTGVQTAAPLRVMTLAPTWYVLGALRAAKRMYDKAMRDERQVVQQARWHDFRLDIDMPSGIYEQHQAYGWNPNGGFEFHTADELTRSLVLDANDAARCFSLNNATGAVSAGALSYNVFTEYDAMDNVDIDQPVVSGGVAPYDDLLEESDTENEQFLQTIGDEPPYNAQSWEAVWVQVGELHSNANGAIQSTTGYFQAPLGLIAIVGPCDAYISEGTLSNDRSRVTVNVLPGNYKGVHADAL